MLFLIIAILLLFTLFSKQGIDVIKNLIGTAQGTAGTTGTTVTDGTNTMTNTGKEFSGGLSGKQISSGILAG